MVVLGGPDQSRVWWGSVPYSHQIPSWLMIASDSPATRGNIWSSYNVLDPVISGLAHFVVGLMSGLVGLPQIDSPANICIRSSYFAHSIVSYVQENDGTTAHYLCE